jgi:hypothetical protein
MEGEGRERERERERRLVESKKMDDLDVAPDLKQNVFKIPVGSLRRTTNPHRLLRSDRR